MDIDLSAAAIVVAILVAAAGAIVQGSAGLGLALIAGPGLVAIDPAFVPGPLLLAGQIIGCRHLIVEHRALDVPTLRRALLGLPFGLALGLGVLAVTETRGRSLVIGGAVVIAATTMLLGVKVTRNKAVEIGTGTMVTAFSVAAGLPGPPAALTYSDMPGPQMRANISALMAFVGPIGLCGLILTDNFGLHELGLTLAIVPGIMAGLLVSRFVRPRIDNEWFRPTVLLIALAGGIATLVRSL